MGVTYKHFYNHLYQQLIHKHALTAVQHLPVLSNVSNCTARLSNEERAALQVTMQQQCYPTYGKEFSDKKCVCTVKAVK